MVKIQLQETVAALDARILAATQAVQSATEELNYLRGIRGYLVHPKAAGIVFHVAPEDNGVKPQGYGGLKRSVFSILSETEAQTPQSIVEAMQAQGFSFRSKTPSISVNEALQTLKTEGKAVLAGKSPSGANLWLSEKGVLAPDDEGVDGQEEEETPA